MPMNTDLKNNSTHTRIPKEPQVIIMGHTLFKTIMKMSEKPLTHSVILKLLNQPHVHIQVLEEATMSSQVQHNKPDT